MPVVALRAENAVSRDVWAKRFQGHASRQSSQPKIRFPISDRSSRGMAPLSSIVRYEIQRRASKRCGALIAPVGQAVMQRSHVPQRSRCGESGGNSIVVRTSEERTRYLVGDRLAL